MTRTPLLAWRGAVVSADGPPNPTTRLVLLVLGLHMDNDGGSCFPSTARVAAMTALTERSVCTHIAEAELLGWIRRESAGASGQRWKRMKYFAIAPKALNLVQHLTPEGTEPVSAAQPEGTEPVSAARPEGTEPDDIKALKDVQSICSVNYSVGDSVRRFCEATGATWRIRTPVDQWAAELKAERRFSGIDIPYELGKAIEWHNDKGKTPKDPHTAIRNWLEKAKPTQQSNGRRDLLMLTAAQLRARENGQ
jgi:hypothetical protein